MLPRWAVPSREEDSRLERDEEEEQRQSQRVLGCKIFWDVHPKRDWGTPAAPWGHPQLLETPLLPRRGWLPLQDPPTPQHPAGPLPAPTSRGVPRSPPSACPGPPDPVPFPAVRVLPAGQHPGHVRGQGAEGGDEDPAVGNRAAHGRLLTGGTPRAPPGRRGPRLVMPRGAGLQRLHPPLHPPLLSLCPAGLGGLSPGLLLPLPLLFAASGVSLLLSDPLQPLTDPLSSLFPFFFFPPPSVIFSSGPATTGSCPSTTRCGSGRSSATSPGGSCPAAAARSSG